MAIVWLLVLAFGAGCWNADAEKANKTLSYIADQWAAEGRSNLYRRIKDFRAREEEALKDPTNNLRDLLDTGINQKNELLTSVELSIKQLKQVPKGAQDNLLKKVDEWLAALEAFKDWLAYDIQALTTTQQRLADVTCPVEAAKILEGYWPELQQKFQDAVNKLPN